MACPYAVRLVSTPSRAAVWAAEGADTTRPPAHRPSRQEPLYY
jgi:hypothetical protein